MLGDFPTSRLVVAVTVVAFDIIDIFSVSTTER